MGECDKKDEHIQLLRKLQKKQQKMTHMQFDKKFKTALQHKTEVEQEMLKKQLSILNRFDNEE